MNVQREFLAELWQKQRQAFEDLQFYLECKQAKDDNEFLSKVETQAFIQSLGWCESKFDYRIGIFYDGEAIEFLRVGRWEDFYKRFPWTWQRL